MLNDEIKRLLEKNTHFSDAEMIINFGFIIFALIDILIKKNFISESDLNGAIKDQIKKQKKMLEEMSEFKNKLTKGV